jgi:hypothetical protein
MQSAEAGVGKPGLEGDAHGLVHGATQGRPP